MRILVLAVFLSTLGCTTLNKPAPLVSGCLNWMPLELDDRGGRIDTMPTRVLISVNQNLQSVLLGLIPEKVSYANYCWYRDVATGGIELYPKNGTGGGVYVFGPSEGEWKFKEKRVIISVN